MAVTIMIASAEVEEESFSVLWGAVTSNTSAVIVNPEPKNTLVVYYVYRNLWWREKAVFILSNTSRLLSSKITGRIGQ